MVLPGPQLGLSGVLSVWLNKMLIKLMPMRSRCVLRPWLRLLMLLVLLLVLLVMLLVLLTVPVRMLMRPRCVLLLRVLL
jgi:hypothetical protein